MTEVELMNRLEEVYMMYMRFRREQEHQDEVDLDFVLPASPYMDEVKDDE